MTNYFPIPVASTTFSSKTYTGGSVPASFDAFLYKPIGGPNQLKLTIKLRIKLNPIAAFPFILDANNRAFFTSPWSGADWARFVSAAAAQADMWNNKFWLLPPPTFDEFDEVYEFDPFWGKLPNKAFRPNIRCALDVDFAATDNLHRTIDVANLNTSMLVALGQPQNPGTFRSHALLYDSLDAVPWAFPLGPGPGQPPIHYVIAHEIGHAIGPGHIGTIKKTPLCEIMINVLGNDGRNTNPCYGVGQGLPLVGNIMGAGADFTVDNVAPWKWALYGMIGRKWLPVQWRVVRSDPGPGSWIDNGLGIKEEEQVSVPVRITAQDDSLILAFPR